MQLEQILVAINQVEIFKYITKPWKLEEDIKKSIKEAIDQYIVQESNRQLVKEFSKKRLGDKSTYETGENVRDLLEKGTDVWSILCKKLIAFNTNLNESTKERQSELIQLQNQVVDLFADNIYGKEMTYVYDDLVENLIHDAFANILIIKQAKKLKYSPRIKNYYQISLAIMKTFLLVFQSDVKQSGVYVISGINGNYHPTISIIAPQVHINLENYKGRLLFIAKLGFLNSVMGSVAAQTGMGYYCTEINGNLVTGLSFKEIVEVQ